jgi:GT2 family glycosyltransferase
LEKKLSPDAILVLGMHRSGTSALTRVLNLLGVELGTNILAPKPDNKTGFWEDSDIVQFNDDLFARMGRGWDDLRELPFEKVNQESLVEIDSILSQSYNDKKLWVLKDPRLCRLLPLYLQVFKQKEILPKAVIIIRSPIEVATSLQKRNGISIEYGLLLWLRHVLEAERNSRGMARVWVSYDALMNNWQSVIGNIQSKLSVQWPSSPTSVAKNVDVFLDHNLRNHRDSETECEINPIIKNLVEETYAVAKECERSTENLTDFEQLFKRMEELESLITDCKLIDRKETLFLRDENSRLKSELSATKKLFEIEKKEHTVHKAQRNVVTVERDEYRQQVEIIRGSRSWRLTRPLRFIARSIRYGWSLPEPSELHAQPITQKVVRAIQIAKDHGFITLSKIIRKKIRQASPQVSQKNLANKPTAKKNYRKITINEVNEPEVSIVIPVYNKFEYTHACLSSVLKHSKETAYEIIIVDDCSTDTTVHIDRYIQGVKVVRNKENLGFVGSCNAGAKIASGQYVLFLNNDTMVRQGWLTSMLECFSKFSNVGLVGSKLLYPDGRLQEAGGIIWDDATGWNYGRLDSPNKPEYNYIREADYCSGASIICPMELFRELGGFDSRYAPAYYEDVDLAFAVRAVGKKVLYQPRSEIIHFEGISSGIDLTSGMKRYQVVNRQKFLDKWQHVLSQHHKPGKSPELAKDYQASKKVLVIDSYTPMPDRDAGSLRIFNIMQILVELGYKVSFVPENRAYAEKYTTLLQGIGVEALYHPYINSIESYLKKNGVELNSVIVSRRDVAMQFLPLTKKYCPKAKIIFDTVDLHFVREARELALKTGSDLDLHKSGSLSKELELAKISDEMWVVSETEKNVLTDISPDISVQVISLIHSVNGTKVKRSDREGIVFIGNFLHPPNIDAIEYFVDKVLPSVRSRLGNVKFSIVGANPPKSIRRYAKTGQNIEVTGFVDEIAPYLNKAILSIAPLRYGAGVKGKISSSMSAGLPVVTTPIGAEGMDLVHGENAMVGDDEEALANHIIELYEDDVLWESISQQGCKHVNDAFSFEKASIKLKQLVC